MENETAAALKRRNSIPSSVVIPDNFDAIPMIKPRKSPSVNGHYYRRLLPSSSSSSPSSNSSVSATATATAEFDLSSFKASPTYTSLKDLLLPPTPCLLSPTPASAAATSVATSAPPGGASTLEISIRNRLVKQAAWAYLQPMASSPSASGRRLWSYFSFDSIWPFMSSIKRALVGWAARACNWLADALWLLLCR